MAKTTLSQKDDQFIDDLISDKQAFFFKEKANSGFNAARGRRPHRGFRIGFSFNRSFIGVYLATRNAEYRYGYTRI